MPGWNDEITLIKTPSHIEGGFTVPGTPERLPVYANKKSVVRTEFYAAMAAGKKAEAIYEVHADEFDDHTEIEDAAGKRFDIVRTFQTSPDVIEITCARR